MTARRKFFRGGKVFGLPCLLMNARIAKSVVSVIILLASVTIAAALPDLTPYQQPNWNNKIPVGVTQLSGSAAHSYNGPYASNQTLYFNWASNNQGNANASGYRVHVEVTGTGGGAWDSTNLSTAAGFVTFLTNDQPFGPLSAGTHTLKVWVDYDNVVSESNESNNYYERTITVTSTQADLTPYLQPNWNDKIPVGVTQLSGSAAHSYNGPYASNQTLYFNWASNNQGNANASGYRVHVEVTGTGGGAWDSTNLSTAAGFVTFLTNDQPFGPLSAGTHTLKVWVDYDNVVSESNESNNYYERTITVTSTQADLTPYLQPNWNDKIPVGVTQLSGSAAHSYNGPYGSNQTLYFNWASNNQGNANASGYRVHVEVTGTGGGAWDATNLSTAAGFVTFLTNDQPFGPLTAGTHTLKVWTDYDNVVSESNESNNYYERIITVTTNPPDIRIEPTTLYFSNASMGATLTPSNQPVAQGEIQVPPSSVSPANSKLIRSEEIYKGFIVGQTTVKIIVNLRSEPRTQSQTDWNSPQSLETLHSANRATEAEVLYTLAGADFKLRFQFDNQAGFSGEITEKGLEQLLNNPTVESIEPVSIVEPNLAQGISLINALTTRSTYSGEGMAIAICDTGIDYNHSKLGGGGFPNAKILGGYDFGDQDGNPIPNGEPHGTACAGIAAGELGTVGDYIGGVAPDARLYALKISSGTSGSALTDAMVAAWDWCVTHKNDDATHPIMVISTSFGRDRNPGTCDTYAPSMTSAANNAVAAGITVLAAAGNDGYCDAIAWPACISSVISVGAVYDAAFGNYTSCVDANSCAAKVPNSGCATGYSAVDSTQPDRVTSYSNVGSFLSVFGPSNACYTTDIVGSAGYNAGDYVSTSSFGGTSAACPYVAGAVASLQSASRAITGSFLTPSQVRTRLAATGDNITDTKVAITKPRVNLGRAIGDLSPSNNTFRIYNDGVALLSIGSIAPETTAPWITWSPSPPFDVPGGQSRDVTVSVDYTKAPLGQSTRRLLVQSNDPDENPYPNGVYVQTTRTSPTPTPTPVPTPTATATATATATPRPTATATATATATPTATATATPTATASPSGTATPSPSCVPGWSAGAAFPAVAVIRAVGNYFPANGRFYTLGGRSAETAGSDFSHPFEYDPGTNTWVTKAATLPDNQVNNMACGVLTVGGTPQIYCVGGSAAGVVAATARVFSYNPVTDAITALPVADNWPGNTTGTILPGGFTVVANKLYIIGGFQLSTNMTAQTWQFDPTAAVGSRWVRRADYPLPRGYIPAATIGGLIYTAGGSTTDGTTFADTAESFKYDPIGDVWTPIANIPRATGETRAVAVNKQMWVLGGGRTAPNPSNVVNSYDPASNTWTTGVPFAAARRNFPADSDGSSRIWLAGGYDATGAVHNTMEFYRSCGSVQLGNISTRLRVGTGDNALIGGFIISGTQQKRVIVRGIGPSLVSFGLTGLLADPMLELHDPSQIIAVNNDWQTNVNHQEIIDLNFAPGDPKEAAILTTLSPGNYTAILRGANNGTGIGAVEVYDLDQTVDSKLANISTRGFVDTGDNVMIGGTIITGSTSANVLIRAIGPTLTNLGVPNTLQDPTLELRDVNGALLDSNDNWWTDHEAEILAAHLAPTDDRESAILANLPPGQYTAIVRGKSSSIGVALIEAYQLQ